MKFHFAPIQGHTDAPYRHFHNMIYEGSLIYYTPFIRLEKDNTLRKRDVKDFKSQLNSDTTVVPQIIFRDNKELSTLVDLLKRNGATRIDLNMGCPFPLQTGHGRGAATILNNELAKAVTQIVNDNPDISFSVKMRLGLSDSNEWQTLLPYINEIKLDHIALHPRVARQQYSGDINYDQLNAFLESSYNPIVFNGDIHTVDDVVNITKKFPTISGIMIGRGALGRPSLFKEIISGEEWSKEKRLETMLTFHRHLLNYYEAELCGESQIISKIQPFWEYAENEIGRKAWKAIKKASNMAKYNSAVALIQ